MTAAILGLTASYIENNRQPIRFDMDPLDAPDPLDPTIQTQEN